MPHRGETEAQAETRRLAFETRRDQSVLDRLYEVERDTDFNTAELYHVPYYQTIEEQNQFLNSIAHTQFGAELLRTQEKYTRDRVPMIIPRFSNTRLEPITSSTVYDYTFPDVTKKEEEFLIAMDLGIVYDRNGRMAGGIGKVQAFKDIVNGTFKYSTELEWIGGGQGRYQEKSKQQVDPSTSAGYRTNTLKYGYEEPEITTVDIDPYVPPTEKPFEKPDYRGTQPEPEITTDDIDPYVPPTEKPFEKPPRVSVFQPAEPEVTTDHIEPPGVEQDFLPPEKIIDPDIIFEEPEPEITTDHIEPPGVEEPQVTTADIDPPVEEPSVEEVTAQISWFGDTWFPWHLELEDRRRR